MALGDVVKRDGALCCVMFHLLGAVPTRSSVFGDATLRACAYYLSVAVPKCRGVFSSLGLSDEGRRACMLACRELNPLGLHDFLLSHE